MTQPELIAKSRRLVVARWWVYVLMWACVVLVASAARPEHARTLLPVILGLLALGGGAGLVLLQISRRLNRDLVEKLSIEEIRALIRMHGRPSLIGFRRGYIDLVTAALPKISRRSDLSESEWQMVAGTFVHDLTQLGRASDSLLRSLKVHEAAVWFQRSSSASSRPSKRVRSLTNDLSRISLKERESLSGFADHVPDPYSFSDYVEAAREEAFAANCFWASIAILIAGLAITVFVGSRDFFGYVFYAVIAFAYGSVRMRDLRLYRPAPSNPDVLPELVEWYKGANGRREHSIRRMAVISAVLGTVDFSGMRTEHYLTLLDIWGSGLKFGREQLAIVLRDHAPASVVCRVREELQHWMESKSASSPQRITELTEIRLGILRRTTLPTPEQNVSMQEVP